MSEDNIANRESDRGIARLAVSLINFTNWLNLQDIGINVIGVEKSIDDVVYLIIAGDKLPRRRNDGGLRVVTLSLTKTDDPLRPTPKIHV